MTVMRKGFATFADAVDSRVRTELLYMAAFGHRERQRKYELLALEDKLIERCVACHDAELGIESKRRHTCGEPWLQLVKQVAK